MVKSFLLLLLRLLPQLWTLGFYFSSLLCAAVVMADGVRAVDRRLSDNYDDDGLCNGNIEEERKVTTSSSSPLEI